MADQQEQQGFRPDANTMQMFQAFVLYMQQQQDSQEFCADVNAMEMLQAFEYYMQQGIPQTHANQLSLPNPTFGAGLENKPYEAKQSGEPKTWQQEMMQQLALENAKHTVFNKRGIFDGYDPEGYLACYEEELELCGVTMENYVKKFHRFVIPDLLEQVQELQHRYSHSWSKFNKAVSRECWDPSLFEADLEHIDVPTNLDVCTQIRAQLEVVVDECMLENVGLFLAEDDEEIAQKIYVKLGLAKSKDLAKCEIFESEDSTMLMDAAETLEGLDLHESLQTLDKSEYRSTKDEDLQDLDIQECMTREVTDLQGSDVQEEQMSHDDWQGEALEEIHTPAEAKCWATEVTAWQPEPVFDDALLEGVQDVPQLLDAIPKGVPYGDELDQEINALFSMHADFAAAEVHRYLTEGKTIEERITEDMINMYVICGQASIQPEMQKVSKASEDGNLELMCLLDEALEGFEKGSQQSDCKHNLIYPDAVDVELMALLDDALQGFHIYNDRDIQQKDMICDLKQRESGDDEELLNMLNETLMDFMPTKDVYVCGLDTEGVCKMGDSNSEDASKTACQGISQVSLGLGYLGMLTGYSDDRQGADISLATWLLDKQVNEHPSLAWKPCYDDSLKGKTEGKIDEIFARHVESYDVHVQIYLDEGHKMVIPSADSVPEICSNHGEGEGNIDTQHKNAYDVNNLDTNDHMLQKGAKMYGKVAKIVWDPGDPGHGDDKQFFLNHTNAKMKLAHTGGCAGSEGVDVVLWHVHTVKVSSYANSCGI